MTTPTPAQQLEPCPFCGSSDVHVGGMIPWVECADCGACGPVAQPVAENEIAERLWNTRTPNTRALAALEAVEGWQVRVLPVAVKDEDDAHRVEVKHGVQSFRVGPDYWDTREEAEAYAGQLRIALAAPKQQAVDKETLAAFERVFWKAVELSGSRDFDHDVCKEVRDFRSLLAALPGKTEVDRG